MSTRRLDTGDFVQVIATKEYGKITGIGGAGISGYIPPVGTIEYENLVDSHTSYTLNNDYKKFYKSSDLLLIATSKHVERTSEEDKLARLAKQIQTIAAGWSKTNFPKFENEILSVLDDMKGVIHGKS